MTQSTDVFIAGGGPAGLAVAIAATQRGMAVTVADSSRPPVDKACGEGIMPDGLAAMRSLGVELTGSLGAPFEGIRFVDAAGESRARFPRGNGFGMKRATLHSVLVAKAETVGVRLLWGTRVEAVRQGEVVAGTTTFRSRYIVCADGQNSSLRRTAGFGEGRVSRRRYGFRSHYQMRPWSSFVEVHWANCGQLYVTPVGAEEICVVLITPDQHTRLGEALPSFPEVQQHLAGQRITDRSMGAVTATRKLKAVTRGCIALLGDASGSADAITGDGLSLAFQQATVLAEAMLSGDLSEYQRKHEKITGFPRNMGELMLLLHDYPWLRKRFFLGLAQSPETFEKLLAIHTRTISPMQLGLLDCLQFGWCLLRA